MRLRWPLLSMVGLIATTNVALVWAAVDAAPTKAQERPFLASRDEDANARARAAFQHTDGRIHISCQDRTASIELTASGGATDLAIDRYRPDDPTLDQRTPWDGTTTTIALPKRGKWTLRIHGTIAGDRGQLMEQTVEVP